MAGAVCKPSRHKCTADPGCSQGWRSQPAVASRPVAAIWEVQSNSHLGHARHRPPEQGGLCADQQSHQEDAGMWVTWGAHGPC